MEERYSIDERSGIRRVSIHNGQQACRLPPLMTFLQHVQARRRWTSTSTACTERLPANCVATSVAKENNDASIDPPPTMNTQAPLQRPVPSLPFPKPFDAISTTRPTGTSTQLQPEQSTQSNESAGSVEFLIYTHLSRSPSPDPTKPRRRHPALALRQKTPQHR